jgi:hypothetical protein
MNRIVAVGSRLVLSCLSIPVRPQESGGEQSAPRQLNQILVL